MTQKLTSISLGILSFLLAVVSIISLQPLQTQAASALPSESLIQTNTPLNLRSSPCGQIVHTLSKGKFLSIISSKVHYCKINGITYAYQAVGNTGLEAGILYVATRYVTRVGNFWPSFEEKLKTITPGTSLNFRKSPCGTVIGNLPHNSSVRAANTDGISMKVCYLGGRRQAFVKVKTASGKIGYVSAFYLARFYS